MSEERVQTPRWVRNVAMLVLMAGLIAYVIYHCVLYFRGDITTAVAVRQTERESISTTGAIFRRETVLTSERGGAVQWLADEDGNGEKVAVGQKLARVYAEGEGEALFEQLRALDEQIAFYKTCLAAENMKYNKLPELSQSVRQTFADMMEALTGGNLAAAREESDAWLLAMSQYQVLVGDAEGMDTALSALLTRRDTLEHAYSGSFDTLTAGASAYFFRQTDGYEEIFTAEALATLTPEGFDRLIGTEPSTTGNRAGKLVTDFAWELALCLSEEQADYYEEGEAYDVTFAAGQTLSMALSRKSAPSEGRVLLVFRTTSMPQGFAYTRMQEVTLEGRATTGLRVPETALVWDEDGGVGVYILDVAYVRYRRIDVIWKGDGYVLAVEYDRTKYGMENELAFQDLIITGSDEELYDGKVYR